MNKVTGQKITLTEDSEAESVYVVLDGNRVHVAPEDQLPRLAELVDYLNTNVRGDITAYTDGTVEGDIRPGIRHRASFDGYPGEGNTYFAHRGGRAYFADPDFKAVERFMANRPDLTGPVSELDHLHVCQQTLMAGNTDRHMYAQSALDTVLGSLTAHERASLPAGPEAVEVAILNWIVAYAEGFKDLVHGFLEDVAGCESPGDVIALERATFPRHKHYPAGAGRIVEALTGAWSRSGPIPSTTPDTGWGVPVGTAGKHFYTVVNRDKETLFIHRDGRMIAGDRWEGDVPSTPVLVTSIESETANV